MNGKEEPVEIEVEPEIFPFDDFYIDQFVDYLDSNDSDNVNDQLYNTSSHHNNNSSSSNNNNKLKLSSYKCTVCREVLGSGVELLKHVRTHTRHNESHRNSHNSKKTMKCCICWKAFDDPTILKMHEEIQHSPPFRCRHCNSFHTVLKYYKAHLKLHQTQSWQLQQRSLRRNSSLSSSRVPEQHQLQHTNNNHHHQNKQSKKLSSGFKHHFYTPPPKLGVQTNLSSNQGLPPSSLSPLRCKYCSKLFAKFTTLRKHEMLHKMNGNQQKINPEVDLVDMQSDDNHQNDQPSHHMNVNSKSSSLTLTPSLLSNLNKLATLKSSELSDGKKPAILININTNTAEAVEAASVAAVKKSQEMPLNSNSGLMISSVTSINKNFSEQQAPAAAIASNATVFIQNGKKAVSLADLQCPICKKIVSQPFSLKVHLRTHTLEKPYSCPICKKSFSQSCNLKTHMNVHNKQQQQQQQNHSNLYQQPTQSQIQQQQQLTLNNNPLTCNICKKSFLKASSLNTHMISHTAKLYCYACNINFDDDALTYSQHMQMIHNVTMTKDLVSRAKANLQKSESLNLQQRQNEEMQRNYDENQQEEIPRLKETFQVQSSTVENGQIPKLKITIKKEPMAAMTTTVVKQEPKEDDGGNESDSSSSSSSSNSSSSSSSSGSSSSSSSNDERRDNK